MADSSGDKKHSATDKKRRQAREKGQVVKSQDLASAAMLIAAIMALRALGGNAGTQLVQGVREAMTHH